jgi:hypothetical protein
MDLRPQVYLFGIVKSMRVLVCGGRNYTDRDHIWNTLCELDIKYGPFTLIIHGCATGADNEAMIWAQAMPGVKHLPFEADWVRHGRAAGPLRNRRMIYEGKPELAVAFPGGKGTADMVAQAERAGIKVIRVQAKEKAMSAKARP